MTEIQGRGGRIIPVDEKCAIRLNTAMNAIPHAREAAQTEPMVVLTLPRLTILDRISDWGNRAADWLDGHGLSMAGMIVAAVVVGLFLFGVTR